MNRKKQGEFYNIITFHWQILKLHFVFHILDLSFHFSFLVLISVSDKTGLIELTKDLIKLNFDIIASDGTAMYLQNVNIPVERVSMLTKTPEILGGRVKTLHPAIFGGN